MPCFNEAAAQHHGKHEQGEQLEMLQVAASMRPRLNATGNGVGLALAYAGAELLQ